ncbi:hypothetical protein [Marininema halotolerans]|uniref:Uncharacterized protein n=1 Tax=Marininema halotolerans TaxID=1155944 RepID=A0A1I6S276_9BACL|nr:hypothetical protein [Marininema halotolerans]SFS70848.1 hypothetical protein SAMN05444972_10687 [Marininema halotolerans]
MKSKHHIALFLALFMLIFAIPRLPVPGIDQTSKLFTFLWLGFAYLVIAANWRKVLQLDREGRRQEEQDRRKRWLEVQRSNKVAQRKVRRLY